MASSRAPERLWLTIPDGPERVEYIRADIAKAEVAEKLAREAGRRWYVKEDGGDGFYFSAEWLTTHESSEDA